MKFNLNKLFGAQDMTVGNPYVNIIRFSVPLLVGNVVQQLYNTVDSIVVGRYVGDGALAAVGTAGPILNLLLVLFMGISAGVGIMVSQYFGAKDRENLSLTVGNAMTLTLVSTVAVMALGFLVTKPLLSIMNTPEDIFDMTSDYLLIIFGCFIGSAFYNMVSGILRGMGDSIMPLLFLVVACVLNIFLDIYFVAGLGWGVAGVAWATVIAQAISAVLCVWRLLRMQDTVDINRKTLRPHKAVTKRVITLGLPSGLTQMIFSLAAIVVQSLTNSFGTTVIACCVVVMRVDGFAMMPNFTFGMALTTYAGQNVGAGLLKRVDTGTKAGVKIGIGVSAVLTACILLFGRGLMRLFTQTPELVDMGMHMMSIIAVGYICMSVTQVLSGVMRGAGDTVTPMWISFITTVALRMPIAYGMAYLTRSAELPNGNPDSLYWSLLISWVLGMIITAVCFKVGRWRKKGFTKVSEEKAA